MPATSTSIRTILQGEATTVVASNDGTATSFNGPASASRSACKNFDYGGLGGVIGWTRWADGNVSHDGTLSYNTNTGVLTPAMFENVFAKVRSDLG